MIAATSCGDASSKDKTTPETVTIPQPTTETVISDTTIKPQQTPSKITIPVNTTTQPVAPAISSATGLNPEHGKPGHRCDIAVGAPLNSKPTLPAETPKSAISQTPTPPTINKQPVPSTTVATGLNPEHGKPGHRCDIAVGASLNSKPTQPAATPTSSISQTPPTINKQAAPPAKVAAGMNPSHGQPGHRCDIAVGAPLNSKPAQ